MKQVIAVVLLLLVVLGGIGWNASYIHRVADRMNALLDSLPALPDRDAVTISENLLQIWEKELPTVGLSVSYTVADRVSEQAVALCSYAAARDPAGYRVSMNLLRDAVGDMRRLERFSVSNLF